MAYLFLAGPTGFEPAISSVTGRRDRPTSLRALAYLLKSNRGNSINLIRGKQWLELNELFRRVFLLQRVGIGRDRLQVELDVRGADIARVCL